MWSMFVKVQLPEDEMDAVHEMRGSVPLSAWIRDLVHDTLVAGRALAPERAAFPLRTVEGAPIPSSSAEATHEHSAKEVGNPPVALSKGQSAQLASLQPSRPAGAMVAQPRPIVQKASKGKR